MFKVPKRDLVRALEGVACVASKRAIQPILKCARLTITNGSLTVQATDLFVTSTATIAVEEAKPVDVAVDASSMLARVKSLEDGDVIVDAKAKGLEVRSGKARKFTIPAMPGEDFPPLPSPDDAEPLSDIGAAALVRLLDGARYAASRDVARPHLSGVLIRLRGGEVRAVATDGHRLAMRTMKVEGASNAPDMLVSNAGVAEIVRMASGGDGDDVVRLATQAGTLVARRDGACVTLKLVDAQFPPFEQFVEVATDRAVIVDRQRLADGIKAVSVACDVHGRLALDVTGDRMRLVASSADAGEFTDEFAASLDGKPVRSAFMWRYLADAVASVAEEDVTLGFSEELMPMVLRTADTTAIVMPLAV